MKVVEVKTAPGYQVMIGPGLLAQCGAHILQVHKPCTAALVTDDVVDGLYAGTAVRSLEQAGFQVVKFVLPHGEESKNLDNYGRLLSFLAREQVTRSDLIVALGGGVVGDLAGFAAATYQRGMEFVQLATTLLAQVDSSVGGKTAVDLPEGKNLVGAFWQPRLVLCDTDCLTTLPEEIKADGLGETVKYAMIADRNILDRLAEGGLEREPEEIVSRCIQIKADTVAADERDVGERQKLNFGHTVAHGVERWSHYTISHGHAVAIGMAVITRACVRRGRIGGETWQELKNAMDRCGLPTQCPVSAKELAQAAAADKKRRGSQMTLVLPKALGECELVPVPLTELEGFFQDGLEEI